MRPPSPLPDMPGPGGALSAYGQARQRQLSDTRNGFEVHSIASKKREGVVAMREACCCCCYCCCCDYASASRVARDDFEGVESITLLELNWMLVADATSYSYISYLVLLLSIS